MRVQAKESESEKRGRSSRDYERENPHCLISCVVMSMIGSCLTVAPAQCQMLDGEHGLSIITAFDH